jgi:Uma2 family endonuclease
MDAAAQTKMTLEEYLEFDKNSDGRFEFHNGYIVEMSGVSIEHGDIEANLMTILKNKVADRDCKINPANIRLKVPKLPTYRYADLSALCGKRIVEKFSGLDVLVNPALIVEVLSPSTENYDRVEKFTEYKSIESFREYLLISQTKPFVTLYTKYNEIFWFQSEYKVGETLKLESLDCELNVDEIYAGITFELE